METLWKTVYQPLSHRTKHRQAIQASAAFLETYPAELRALSTGRPAHRDSEQLFHYCPTLDTAVMLFHRWIEKLTHSCYGTVCRNKDYSCVSEVFIAMTNTEETEKDELPSQKSQDEPTSSLQPPGPSDLTHLCAVPFLLAIPSPELQLCSHPLPFRFELQPDHLFRIPCVGWSAQVLGLLLGTEPRT